MKQQRVIRQRNWAVSLTVFATFLLELALVGKFILDYLTGEVIYLVGHWPPFKAWFMVNNDLTLRIFCVAEAVLLLAVIILAHESCHYLAYLLQGVSKKNVHFKMIGINPSVVVDIPLRRNVKMVSAAAPVVMLILPVVVILVLIGNSPWRGLLSAEAVVAWGISSSDIALILQYLKIPHQAMIEEAKGGELAIWE